MNDMEIQSWKRNLELSRCLSFLERGRRGREGRREICQHLGVGKKAVSRQKYGQTDRQMAHLNMSRLMMVSTSPRSETPIAMMDIKSRENVTRGLTTSTWGRMSCRTSNAQLN